MLLELQASDIYGNKHNAEAFTAFMLLKMQGFNTDFEANKKAEDFLSEGYLVPVVEAVG